MNNFRKNVWHLDYNYRPSATGKDYDGSLYKKYIVTLHTAEHNTQTRYN